MVAIQDLLVLYTTKGSLNHYIIAIGCVWTGSRAIRVRGEKFKIVVLKLRDFTPEVKALVVKALVVKALVAQMLPL